MWRWGRCLWMVCAIVCSWPQGPADAATPHEPSRAPGANGHLAGDRVVRAAAMLEAARAAVSHGGHPDHAAALADCHAHWGRELGPLLCPAMFADEEGYSGQSNVEVRLLGALWHIAGRQAGVWWTRGGQMVRQIWTEVRALQGDDAAP